MEDILADTPGVEYFDPRLIGTSAEWGYGDSEESHQADLAEWVCGGEEESGGVRSYYKSVYKLTLTAPVDNSEEDSGMEVSSMEDSSVEG